MPLNKETKLNQNKLFPYKSYMYIHLTVCKQMIVSRIIRVRLKIPETFNCTKKVLSGSFKNVIDKICLQILVYL